MGIVLVAASVSCSDVAEAGACCAGSTSAFPARVGECERYVVATGIGATTSIGRWDESGAMRPSGVQETDLLANLGAGWRLSRDAQLLASAPVRFGWRTADDETSTGGGLGDVRLGALFDPVEESLDGPPIPVVTVGARIPTGRDWKRSEAPLLADVTGLPSTAVTAALGMEKTLGVPWGLGIETEVPVDSDEPMVLGGWASYGHYFGVGWTVLGEVRHTVTIADGSAHRTRLGARVVRGQRLAWRAWAGVDADVPAPYVGKSNVQRVDTSVGFAWVR